MSDDGADPWREVFRRSVTTALGEVGARGVMEGEEDARAQDNVSWTKGRLERLFAVAGDGEARCILMGCAHVLPEERIRVLREFYARHGSIEELMEFWRSQFIYNLKKWTGPRAEWLDTILENNWGEVGVREGRDVIAIKVPKDAKGYFEAADGPHRAFSYCHCDRVRGAFLEGIMDLPGEYCYCAAGFYRSNWERVVGGPVEVVLERSLLKGDPVCQFRIRLPGLALDGETGRKGEG